MKTRFYHLNYGNKAFFLALDVALAVIVAVGLLVIANYYVGSSENKLAELQMIRTGSDIITVLDNKGVLDSLDEETIKDELSSLLPPYYNIRIQLYGAFSSETIIIETESELAEGKFIGRGKRFFRANGENGIVKYQIWSK